MRHRSAQPPSDFALKLAHAQRIAAYLIDGEAMARIKFGDGAGDELLPWSAGCKGCSVAKGDFHFPMCSEESCPKCGWMTALCDCCAEGEMPTCLDARGAEVPPRIEP